VNIDTVIFAETNIKKIEVEQAGEKDDKRTCLLDVSLEIQLKQC